MIVSLGGDHIVEHRRVPRAALKTTAIVLTPHELRISLGAEPIPVPKPFAGMLRFHLHNRLTSALPATARPVIGCRRVNGTLAARSLEFGDVSGCVISGSVGVTCGHSDMG